MVDLSTEVDLVGEGVLNVQTCSDLFENALFVPLQGVEQGVAGGGEEVRDEVVLEGDVDLAVRLVGVKDEAPVDQEGEKGLVPLRARAPSVVGKHSSEQVSELFDVGADRLYEVGLAPEDVDELFFGDEGAVLFDSEVLGQAEALIVGKAFYDVFNEHRPPLGNFSCPPVRLLDPS
ncbi:MAG: hypothetical protein BWY86_00269 [Candidatus Aminicenantes bacterium ADurb.Bin508]|nr:MAG: hypothetical protein BWY86_00269 [Candidatus Aminicenantes bacterium ADurb.Bin508]